MMKRWNIVKIKRAVNWAGKRYNLIDNSYKWHKGAFNKYDIERTDYSPDSLYKSSDGATILKSK